MFVSGLNVCVRSYAATVAPGDGVAGSVSVGTDL